MPVCFDNVHAVHGLDDVHSGHAGGAHHQASALDPGVGHKVLEKTKKSITTTPGEGPVRGGDPTPSLPKNVFRCRGLKGFETSAYERWGVVC